MKTTYRIMLLACAAPTIVACSTVDNARLDVAGVQPIGLSHADAHLGQSMTPATSPSLSGVSRAHWEPMTIELWPDGTQHWPRLTRGGPIKIDNTARQRGEHPTALTALEIEPDRWAEAQEWWAGPIHAAADVVMALPRVIVGVSNGWIVASPANRYARSVVRYDGPELTPVMVPIDEPKSDGDEDE